MTNNPPSPTTPISQPGTSPPDSEIRQPGSYRPERDADPEPPVDTDPVKTPQP